MADYAVEKQYKENILPQESLSAQESWYLKKLKSKNIGRCKPNRGKTFIIYLAFLAV